MMQSIIRAIAALLLAGVGWAPLAAAQIMDRLPPQLAVSQPTTQPSAIPCYRQQQTMLPPGRADDPLAKPVGMGSDFDPYPPGYGLYSGGN